MTASILVDRRGQGAWPKLPLSEWRDTLNTLHRWVQIVGKTRLKLAPFENHWWHVTLYPTARGLTTSPMPSGSRTVEVELDFIDHNLLVRTGEGATRAMALMPRTVSDFYREYRALLETVGFPVKIWPVPNEMEDALPFPDDQEHRSYDPEYAGRCWKILAQAARVLHRFRGRFLGKSSPVHFFWGAFDLACTRFSGRAAPEHPAGFPNIPDWAVREAYSHECISAGWWPGDPRFPEPGFYSYSYPEPPGFSGAKVGPAEAYYHQELREFLLPYEVIRTSSRPDELLLQFFQSTYQSGAELGGWDRRVLERDGKA